MSLSLLDTADCLVRRWYVLYHERVPQLPFQRWLKPGFRHIELARPLQYGPALTDVMWLHLLPSVETLDAEVSLDPTPPWVRCPSSTIQRVEAARRSGSMRQWWHFGPISCVEYAKAALGINAFWVRTPWQLYQYISRRDGVVISR